MPGSDESFDHYQLLVSNETVAEFDDVAGREKFNDYLEEVEREIFEELLHREARLTKVTETITVSRDPDDDKFLGLAVAGGGGVVVSGGEDLLALDPFRDIGFVGPRAFEEEFPPLEEQAL